MSATGPDDRGFSGWQLIDNAKPVPNPNVPPPLYAPPRHPRGPADLPDIQGIEGAKFKRGDDVELAMILHSRYFGKYVVSVGGELWQYDPDRRGWWRIPPETAITWVARVAGGCILAGFNRKGEPKLRPIAISASKASGAVRLAVARCHHAEEGGDYWAGELRGYHRGIAQFQDRAVIVTQSGPGTLKVSVEDPKPEHRVRALRVMPCRWLGMPALDDLQAVCPVLWGIHLDWWGHHGEEEARARLMAILEFVGASMLGYATVMAKAVLLLGEGGTGKSTMIDLMTRWCQPSAVSSVTPQEMGTNRFAPARMDGVVLNVVDDIPHEPILDAGVWKSAITGGRIDVERKGRDGHGIYPRAGHLYAGNRLPPVVKANDGFWRRWLVIEYDRQFSGTSQDRPVMFELMGEMDRIIAFAIAAFVDTGGHGGRGYTTPACHRVAMGEWSDVSDSVGAFSRECLQVVDPDVPKVNWTKRSTVYKEYRDWCEEGGRRAVSAHEWGSRMRSMGFEVVQSRGSWRVGCAHQPIEV